MPILFRDFETRSLLDLSEVGAHRYMADESTQVLCCSFAEDDGPVQLWTPGKLTPEQWSTAAADSSWLVVAHNDGFETAVEERLGWPVAPLERHRCTVAMARACALPGSLDGAAEALGLDIRKDKAGARLMKQIATRKIEPILDDLERLGAYCRQDTGILRALFKRLPPLIDAEQALWVLDQQINARGFAADRKLAEAMRDVAVKRRAEIAAELTELTGGLVTSPNQTARILQWLNSHGYDSDNLDKKVKAKLLSQILPREVQRLLELVTEGALKTIGKADALLASIGQDGRIRDTSIFCGAASGRFSANGFQPQNVSREDEELDTAAAFAAFMRRDLAAISRLGPPLKVAAAIARGLITAAPGKLLLCADYGQIEARVLAWFAGEAHVLEDLRKYDETGDQQLEVYCRAASLILGRTVTKADKNARQIGKTAILALGYGGGVRAWRNYDENTPEPEVRRHIAAWKKSRPKTVAFWNALDNTLRRAIGEADTAFTLGRLTIWSRGRALHIQLPSKRVLRFPDAEVVDGSYEDTWNIRFRKWERGKWKPVEEWFGKFVATAVSATARDLLAAAMLRIAAADYDIVLTVHDEIVVEVPDDGVDRRQDFVRLMTQLPEWAEDLPVAAEARCGRRYIKTDDNSNIEEEPPGDELEIGEGLEIGELLEIGDECGCPGDQGQGLLPWPQAFLESPWDSGKGKSPPEPLGDSRKDWRPPEFQRAREGFASPQPPEVQPKPAYVTGRQADAGKPYAPACMRLLERGYRLVRSFPFFLPGMSEPLFWEDRYEKPAKNGAKRAKECRFRHTVNGVELCDTGPRRILYGLASLVKTPLKTPVFITEGAAKCEPLIAAGLVTVAAPYHSFKGECATALAGRSLVYLEDADQPGADSRCAAKEFSARAQRQLGPWAASFRILPGAALWKDLGRTGEPPHGFDVVDWLAGGGKTERLVALAGEMPEAEPVEPVDLWGHFDPPPLPEGLLPKEIEEFAREQGILMGADPAGLAMAALAVCAGALPDHTKLRVKRHDAHWLEAARLWVGLIGDPSTKKSPIMKRASAAIRQIDMDLWGTYQAEAEAYESLSPDEKKKFKKPVPISLLLGDTTIESAQEVLAENVNGVLCVHDELSGWFGSMDKYSSSRGASADRAFWLKTYDGVPDKVNRISRGRRVIPNHSVTMLGGIQHEPLRQIAAESVDDGLLQRIIPITLASASVGRDAPGGQAGRAYDALVRRLRERKPPASPLRFDDAAQAIRDDLERRHLELQQCELFNKRLASHIGKYDGMFARMCLLWHCIENPDGYAVTEATARRVAEFMHRYMLPHAVAFYAGALELSDDHDRISQLAGYILSQRKTFIVSSDISSGIRSMRKLTAKDVASLCEQLEALGWLFRARQSPARWDVNPMVHRKFTARAAKETRERATSRAAILEAAVKRRAERQAEESAHDL